MEKRWYTVTASTGPVPTLAEDVLERLGEALTESVYLSGTVTSGDLLTRRLSIRGSLEAEGMQRATVDGIADVNRAFRAIGIPPQVVDFRVIEDLAEDEFSSARDDIVGTPDVAERLGISRQRVAQLVDQKGRFPTPIATVRGTHVWQWGDIADWVAAGARDMRRRQTQVDDEVQVDASKHQLPRQGLPPRDNAIDLLDALKRKVARESRPRAAAAKKLAR